MLNQIAGQILANLPIRAATWIGRGLEGEKGGYAGGTLYNRMRGRGDGGLAYNTTAAGGSDSVVMTRRAGGGIQGVMLM